MLWFEFDRNVLYPEPIHTFIIGTVNYVRYAWGDAPVFMLNQVGGLYPALNAIRLNND